MIFQTENITCGAWDVTKYGTYVSKFGDWRICKGVAGVGVRR